MTNFSLDVKELNKFIERFRKSKEQAEKEIADIDEKYRKLAEKEKKELNIAIKRCQKEIDFWEKSVLSRYSEDADVSTTAEDVEDDDIVVDNESNAEETIGPDGPVVEEVNIKNEMFRDAFESKEVEEPVSEKTEEVVEDSNSDDDWGEQTQIDPNDVWPDVAPTSW